jgi:alpha-N-arabinofuranosidase
VYASSVIDENSNEIIVKLVNSGSEIQTVDIALKGAKKVDKNGKWVLLNSNDLENVNSIEDPMNVSPEEKEIELKGEKLSLGLPPYSLSVIKVSQK